MMNSMWAWGRGQLHIKNVILQATGVHVSKQISWQLGAGLLNGIANTCPILFKYAENFCWSEDTYYLPPEMHVAQVHESER